MYGLIVILIVEILFFTTYTSFNVLKNVHVIYECVVRRIVRIKILMDITVGKVLRTHIIEMVGYLQFSPVCDDIFVAGVFDFFLEPIELVNGI